MKIEEIEKQTFLDHLFSLGKKRQILFKISIVQDSLVQALITFHAN